MHRDEAGGRHWQHNHSHSHSIPSTCFLSAEDFLEEDNFVRGSFVKEYLGEDTFVKDDIAEDGLVDKFIIEDAVVEDAFVVDAFVVDAFVEDDMAEDCFEGSFFEWCFVLCGSSSTPSRSCACNAKVRICVVASGSGALMGRSGPKCTTEEGTACGSWMSLSLSIWEPGLAT